MTSRESLPNAAVLEQIEAPSREVAEAKRRAAEAEAADKPALKDAVDTLRRLEGEQEPTAIELLAPAIHANAPPGQLAVNRGPRGTLKGPGPGRVEQQTSPSLARVLAGPVSSDGNELVEDSGDEIADGGREATAHLPKTRPVVVIGVAVLALALILGMLAIALWGGDEAATPSSASGQKTATSSTMASPSTGQTSPVSAIATATADPPATSAAITADPVRSTASARSTSKASAKASVSAQAPVATTVRSNPPAPASSLPPGWNPNI